MGENMSSLDCDDFVESVPRDDWERETGGCGGVLSRRTGLFRHFFSRKIMPRIRYSDEVRAEILRRVGSGEVSHAQAAREVGCTFSQHDPEPAL